MNNAAPGTEFNINDASRELRVAFYNSPVNIAQCNPTFGGYADGPGLDGRVRALTYSMNLRVQRSFASREQQQVQLVPYGDKAPVRVFY